MRSILVVPHVAGTREADDRNGHVRFDERKGKRSDGLLGERDHERRRVLSAPPAAYAAAPSAHSLRPTGASFAVSSAVSE
jgi:hypothetical protein